MQLLARPRRPEALPQRLDRHRIYVLPTRFGLFVATLLSAMLLGALNYNNNPALLLALLLAAAAIASAIAAHLQLSGLQIDAISAEPVPAGQPLRLRVDLSLRDRARAMGCTCSWREARPRAAGAGSRRSGAGCPQRAPRLAGTAAHPPVQYATAGAGARVVVGVAGTAAAGLPAGRGPGTAPPGKWQRSLHTRAHATGEELHQLRPYRAGDAPRSIAWKHSARRDSLLVREYEKPIGIEVVLDWRTLAPLAHEARIARLARWVDMAEREGRRYTAASGASAIGSRPRRQPPPPVPARAGVDAP